MGIQQVLGLAKRVEKAAPPIVYPRSPNASGAAPDQAASLLRPGQTLERPSFDPVKFKPLTDTRLSDADRAAGIISDAPALQRAKPAQIFQPETVEDVRAVYSLAREKNMPVAMSGAKHSMGGQNVVEGALHMDMTAMNRVAYDAKKGTILVQPGAKWSDVQRLLDPHGKAPKVMQSSNIFTVGGSLAADIHGRDWRFGPISDTVEAIKLLRPNGELVTASRTENTELLRATLGGYGLTGTIVEAELQTLKNEPFKRFTTNMKLDDFPAWFDKNIRDNPNARIMQGRVTPNTFDDMHVIQFEHNPGGKVKPLKQKGPGRLTHVFGIPFRAQMTSETARVAGWWAYKTFDRVPLKMSRNQATSQTLEFLRPPNGKWIKEHTQITQEYFVPKAKVADFVRALGKTEKKHDANIVAITIRHVKGSDSSMLTPTPEDTFAVMTFVNQPLKGGVEASQARMGEYTRELTQTALGMGGRPYLAYRTMSDAGDIAKGYPEVKEFARVVKANDPDDLLQHGLRPRIVEEQL